MSKYEHLDNLELLELFSSLRFDEGFDQGYCGDAEHEYCMCSSDRDTYSIEVELRKRLGV